jgi:hypothetical protein
VNIWGPKDDPRVLIPDKYPRDIDPLRPAASSYAPELERDFDARGYGTRNELSAFAGRVGFGSRPITYRRFVTYQITAGTTPMPLLNQNSEVETIVIQVPETASVPAFVGGQSVNTVSGVRLNAGRGVILTEDNDRRNTEIMQRQDEQTMLLSLMAQAQWEPPPIDTTPVTVLNPNDFYVMASLSRAVNVWLFFVPERL